MNHSAAAQAQEITHKIRAIVRELNSDMYWERQQTPQDRDAGLRNRILVDMAGSSTSETTIKSDGHIVDSRNMARPPPGARANRLAPGR